MIGRLDKREEFAGGAEELEVRTSRQIRHVQIVTEGFTIQDATIEVLPWGSQTWRTVTEGITAGETDYILVIDDFNLEAVKVSGVTAGSHFVTVSQ